MLPNFQPRAKYRPSRGESSSAPQVDGIPLSEMVKTASSQDSVHQENNEAGQQLRSRRHLVCYLLHAFLVVLHLILLALAVWDHPEHRIVFLSASQILTIGLSGGLQVFYTLYTALLVFVTQRLMLSTVFSAPTKLTQIHDICGAWCGLGAALSTLWQQTEVTSSIFPVALVAIYLIGISVLHVASSTIMQLQPFNVSMTSTASAVATWPHPLSIFASNVAGVATQTSIASIVPYTQKLYGNATTGLVNNTLYDIPVPAFVNATVNATTLNAHCGLLTNLSNAVDNDVFGWTFVQMTDLGNYMVILDKLLLPNEVWMLSQDADQDFMVFSVSAKVKIDPSVSGTDHIYTNGTFSPPGRVAQNFTTPTYLVGCTLDTTSTTATLGTSGVQVNSDEQPTNTTWSVFSPNGDMNLTNTIKSLLVIARGLAGNSSYCLPVIPDWTTLGTFDFYMASALGMSLSMCGDTSIEQYTTTPYYLTRDRMETVISRIAAEFVWLAGQWGEAAGGFNRQTEEAQITEYVIKWRLNINLLPVITSLCISIVLCILVTCMLSWQDGEKEIIPADGMLEIMWFGSRSSSLRNHLCSIRNPSMDNLRAPSMFEAVLRTFPAKMHEEQETSGLYTAIPLYDTAHHFGNSGPPVALIRGGDSKSHLAVLGSSTDVARSRRVESLQPQTGKPRNTFRSLLLWCNTLHIVLISLHIALLSLLVHHPEHSVTIPIETNTMTVSLTALSQAAYMLYSALLVFTLQRLAISKITNERQHLTTVHDVSGSWTGIGAAILVIWQQRKVNSSLRQVAAVVIYLISMLALHATSSSVIHWQAFNSNIPSGIQSSLALPGRDVNISSLPWSEVFPVVELLMGQNSYWSTYGLLNNTLFDIPQVPGNVTMGEVVVNATTLKTQCGLVPNLTLLSHQYDYNAGTSTYHIGFSPDGTSNVSFSIHPTWKDIIYGVNIQCTHCPQTLFYVITTAIDVDDSVNNPALKLNWTYMILSGNSTTTKNSTTLTYIAACSVSAHTIPVMLNLQEHQLNVTLDPAALSTNTSWLMWSPVTATSIGVEVASALGSSWDLTIESPEVINGSASWPATYSIMDDWVMSLLGLNLTAAIDSSWNHSGAHPSVTLTPTELENVVSQITATSLWVAGQLGESNGGFTRTVVESQAMQDVQRWRLHLNTVPIVVASVASFVAFVVSIIILGTKPIQENPASVSGTSVLESLWLEANSEEIHRRLQAVSEPHPDKLRAAGMFPIRIGEVALGPSFRGSESPTPESEVVTLNNDPEDELHLHTRDE